jgi:pyrroloquinoline quinone biosynthesis protein D
MSLPSASARPRLAIGCRLSEATGQEATLLIPEGALRLNGSGLMIVQCCDGQHTFSEIVGKLQALCPAAEAQRLEEDTAMFLQKLHEKRAVDFV